MEIFPVILFAFFGRCMLTRNIFLTYSDPIGHGGEKPHCKIAFLAEGNNH